MATDGTVLHARVRLARREFDAAKALLTRMIQSVPLTLWPRVILSRALLEEGQHSGVDERALLEVLALDPDNAEARHNLDLMRQQWHTAVS